MPQFARLPTGPQGATGQTGAAGVSPSIYHGSGAPSPDLGKVYDLYIDIVTGNLWELEEGWGIITNILGPPGATGAAGAVATAEVDDGNSGATKTLNFSSAPNHKLTLTANCTLSFTGLTAGGTYLLKLVQDGTGSRLMTAWPSGTKFQGGVTPILSTAAGAIDKIVFYYDGTNLFADYGLAYA